MSQAVDSRIKDYVCCLAREGVTNTTEVKRHVEIYVRNELLVDSDVKEQEFSRRCFPRKADIKNMVYRASISMLHSLVDQDNLDEYVKGLNTSKPGDRVFFPPHTEGDSASSKLLLVHQAAW